MKITADTNMLVRAIVEDDPAQARAAQNELEKAELVAITIPALCELASCEEAQRYLNESGLSRLDRDNDGVACESLC